MEENRNVEKEIKQSEEQPQAENPTPATEQTTAEPTSEATESAKPESACCAAEASEESKKEQRKLAKAIAQALGATKHGKTPFFKIFIAALLAFLVGGVVQIALWAAILSGVSAAFAPEKETIPESTILKIDFAEAIIDAPSTDPRASFDINTFSTIKQLSLYKALRAIEAAKSDERVKGIYITLDEVSNLEITALEEIREAVEVFKQSGKFVIAYSETYTQWLYYFASVADKVYMQPEGTFDWVGMSSTNIFFKGLFDKLGVDVEILRPTSCKYKSAVEPFFLSKMSDANRDQMQLIVDDLWSVLTESVSKSRGISVEHLNKLANELAVVLPEEALREKLIDGLMYADQIEELLKSEYNIEEVQYTSLGKYASTLTPNPAHAKSPKVAIVYAQGQVVDGSGNDGIYSQTLSKQIREVAEDDHIKSVVLRVNSPGGSALASDVIWREVKLLQEKKPVVVSMGGTAASGGYYISAPADAIVANRTTLTGSIGVFGMIPIVGKALEKNLGVTIDGVKSNESSNIDGFAPITPLQRAALMRGVDRVYERFTSLVAEGRNLTIEKVLELAEGRVWSGTQAQKNGLADTCGGLTTALAVAIDKAGLGSDYQIVEHIEAPSPFMAALQSLGGISTELLLKAEMGELYKPYKQMRQLVEQKGVHTLCPTTFYINK